MDANKEAEKILQKLPPAPSRVEQWIRKEVVKKAYLIFDNKESKAVCTRCGRTFPLRHTHGAAHNKMSACPYCKTEAMWKKSCYGRKTLTEQFRVLVFTHKGKTVYGTLFEIDADFENFGKARISKWISALYRFTETEQTYFKHSPDWGYGDIWAKRKEVKLPHPPTGYNWGTWCKYERTAVYTENLEAIFTKSCLKYHYDGELFWRFDAYDYIRYIDQCLKYKSMELLRKAGFERLVLDRVCEYSTKSLYIRGDTLKKILRLPKRWHKKVRELDMGGQELRAFQTLTETQKGDVTKETLQQIARVSAYITDIERYLPFFDAVQYMQRQKEEMWMYRDYLDQADLLGWDMTRKNILYPEDLRNAHDETMHLLKEQREQLHMEKLEQCTRRTEETFPEFQAGTYFIRTARTQEELNRESQGLAHCVRTYGNKIAEGRCMIFFIRQTEEPDKPFYTLEVSPDREILQCRGDHNCNMTKEVKAFVKIWANKYNLTYKIREEQEAA